MNRAANRGSVGELFQRRLLSYFSGVHGQMASDDIIRVQPYSYLSLSVLALITEPAGSSFNSTLGATLLLAAHDLVAI